LGKKISYKIVPTISPNKTWVGLLGGIFTTILLSVLFHKVLTPFTLPHAVFIGFILSVIGFVGDITMSAIKRDVGIKDSGSMLPGHGGILDRIDSLIYAGPVFFHFVRYFYVKFS